MSPRRWLVAFLACAACAEGNEPVEAQSGGSGAGGSGGEAASAGGGGGTSGVGGEGGGGVTECTSVEVSAGGEHTCARTSDGRLWCWGHNDHGQLGDGTLTDSVDAVEIASLAGVALQVSAGGRHTCVVANDSTLWCWGDGGNGQLGNGNTSSSAVPIQVTSLGNEVAAVSAAYQHTCALEKDGSVWCWGDNQFGKLGDGTESPQSAPVQVVPLGTSAESISAGEQHTCATKGDGTLWCWGFGGFAQLGNGDNTVMVNPVPIAVTALGTEVAAVSAGGGHTCALEKDGTVWCWGRVQLGNTISDTFQPTIVPLGGPVTSVSAGGKHTCARRMDETLACWGDNFLGQLGDGATDSSAAPVEVKLVGAVSTVSAGREHTCGIQQTGALYCWGGNTFGQVGAVETSTSSVPLQATGLSADVIAIDLGESYGCAIKSDKTLHCWGQGAFGALGLGTKDDSSVAMPVVGLGADVLEASTGGRHVCARRMDSSVWCWGWNFYGELGTGNTMDASAPVQIAALGTTTADVEAGYVHTCARKNDGSLECWGGNLFGAVGDGTTDPSSLPKVVAGLNPAAAVSAGTHRTCATDGGGALSCWGGNLYGQLGNGTTSDSALPIAVASLGSGVEEISAGGGHVCARKTDGSMYCWGDNGYGAVGDGTTTMRTTPVPVASLGTDVAQITTGGAHTCARKKDDSVWCWGSNGFGQLGDGTKLDHHTPTQVPALGNDVLEVRAGNTHTCALLKDGSVRCWGWNMFGELGNGHIPSAPPYAFPAAAKALTECIES